MQTGTSYRLRKDTRAVTSTAGNPSILTIPAGSIVTANGEPSSKTRMIDVIWGERTVSMFWLDLKKRGDLVRSANNAD